MSSPSRRSRAVQELAESPSSPCPHCGRTTKTVQGVCADCWGVKDPEVAIDLRPPPRTEPLLDLGAAFDDIFGIGPLLVTIALTLLVAVVVAAIFVALR